MKTPSQDIELHLHGVLGSQPMVTVSCDNGVHIETGSVY